MSYQRHPGSPRSRGVPNYWPVCGRFWANSGTKCSLDPVKLITSIIHTMKYAKRCATHVATRRRKIRPGRDVIETYKTCAVSRRFYFVLLRSSFNQPFYFEHATPAETHTHFLKGPVRSTRGNAVHLRTQLKPYELSAPPRIAQEPGGTQLLARLWSILGQFGHQVQFGPGQADNLDHTYYEIRQKMCNTCGYAST